MEEHDGFEIVDNDHDKSGFEELVEEDALQTMSDINKEKKEIQTLKQESSKLLKRLREQSAVNTELEAKLREEMKCVNELKLSLSAQKEEMAQLLESMRTAPSAVSKSQSLLEQLNAFYGDTSSMEQELSKLKSLRVQQEQMMNECKIHIETMNSNQKECLVSLDKSKSFACKECGTDIALKDEIESKCYQVGQGQFTEKKRGYLFCNAVNLVLGASKTEVFTTGSYQISWTSCAKCRTQMGWKYMSADNPNNNTKVGKYCLARYSLTSPEDRAQQK
jgi:small-conductance mechanosensitive channel